MLSYRHSFHAGNFADVIKHIVLIEILEHLLSKDKALHYIDTHAGAGMFDLTGEHSLKLQEFRDGVGRLVPEDWPELATYFSIIHAHNAQADLAGYPGSPMIARSLLRRHDRAWLYELHPQDSLLLTETIGRDRRFRVLQEDGYAGLLGLLPPLTRRGLVLIDPSYEVKSEYSRVVEIVLKSHRKFNTGTYALWYPVVERERVVNLERDFENSGIRNIQRFEICVQPDSKERGMTGAGMIVVNPPWTLMARMSVLLPRLSQTLAQAPETSFKADVLVAQ
ncbi:MAG: 23S rRNA (adenine(2030)-N(6))-methyltransferase RlmJ [Proteobacteria bacterium]|nr:23S rRNA (adenine(2030)-N(6))-methyltransferase RlmJ [Pseudomonadota bacterium]